MTAPESVQQAVERLRKDVREFADTAPDGTVFPLTLAQARALVATFDALAAAERVGEALTRKVPPHGRSLRLFMRHMEWCEFMRAPRWGDHGMAPCTCNFVELVDTLDAALDQAQERPTQ